jgi:hypothetical protein
MPTSELDRVNCHQRVKLCAADADQPTASLFPQHQIHNPTAANVRRVGVSAVVEDVLVFAPGVLKCVGENGHRTEVARLVHLPRERNRGVGAPRRRERDRAERIPEDVAQDRGLFTSQAREFCNSLCFRKRTATETGTDGHIRGVTNTLYKPIWKLIEDEPLGVQFDRPPSLKCWAPIRNVTQRAQNFLGRTSERMSIDSISETLRRHQYPLPEFVWVTINRPTTGNTKQEQLATATRRTKIAQ